MGGCAGRQLTEDGNVEISGRDLREGQSSARVVNRPVASAKGHAWEAARPSGTRFQPIYPQILGGYLY